MIRSFKQTRPMLVIGLLVPMLAMPIIARASDHGDTAENANRQGADMTDVFIFPSATPGNVVLVMDTHGLIPAGTGGNVFFDPTVLYQIKIDNTGDYVEDLVIQAKFDGYGPNQQVRIAGPLAPSRVGLVSNFTTHYPTVGTINSLNFSPALGMKVFAGVRSDPFFFDLAAFFAIFPDRATPLTGTQVNLPNFDTPQAPGFRPPGMAMDFFVSPNGGGPNRTGLNVMSIIVDLPRTMLAPVGGKLGVISVWETTSVFAGGFSFRQQDRLARPVINEAFGSVSVNPALGPIPRHETNNKANPTDDPNRIALDIQYFMTNTAGRSQAITDVVKAVLVPDVMKADLSQAGVANYLGVETGGASSPSGSKFGGRALTDDVIDIDLMTIFGPLVPMLKLAPDDGKESPSFTTDNVGPHSDYKAVFPYLGDPH